MMIKKKKMFVSQTGLVFIYVTLSFVCLFQSWFHWYVYYKPARIIQKCHRFQCFSGTAGNFPLFHFHLSVSLYLLSLHLFVCFSICLDFIICLYLCHSVCSLPVSFYSSVYHSICVSSFLYVCLSVSLLASISVSPPLNVHFSISIYSFLSIYLSLSQPVSLISPFV